MKLSNIFETYHSTQLNEEAVGYSVKVIKSNDTELLQKFCEFYNESGQLTWTLTPQRLLSKLGTKGVSAVLLYDDEVVGTIGLKSNNAMSDQYNAGEVGYIMVDENHRSLQAVMMIYKSIKKFFNRFDIVFATTNIQNRTINRLLEYTKDFEKVAEIRSTYSSNILYVWSYIDSKFGNEESKEAIKMAFGSHIRRIF